MKAHLHGVIFFPKNESRAQDAKDLENAVENLCSWDKSGSWCNILELCPWPVPLIAFSKNKTPELYLMESVRRGIWSSPRYLGL